MDVLGSLLGGFAIALTPENLLYCAMGVVLGTLIGVLPGIGPVAGIGVLIPLTFGMDAVGALIMLAGIFYGSMYGGSTTSILINVPGEAASVVTSLEGYQMAKKGRAGAALGIAAIGSFVAGTVSIVGLMLAAPMLVTVALSFGPHEYFTLMLLGMTMVAYLGSRSLTKALAMAVFGLLLSTVGQDPVLGARRFTFERLELIDGISFVPAVIGLFAIGEILYNLQHTKSAQIVDSKIGSVWPTRNDISRSSAPILRGSVVGFLLGVLPGAGALISTFVSYTIEKRLSKHPEEFGKGAIEGVAGPESANNAATGGAMVPLLSLGVPCSPVTAVMLGAFILHGILPGPKLLEQHPDLFWGLVASMYVGNVMLLVLNLPLVGLWASLLRLPYNVLWPLIILFCMVGGYTVNNRASDLLIVVAFGVIGYLMRELDFPTAPVVLALVLGPLMEQNFRQSLIISHGSFAEYVTRPISATLLVLTAILIFGPLILRLVGRRSRPLAQMAGAED
ncbi:MAG: tripartite tricarboxylate transporter permease [Chloroflexota bacterium]